MLYIYLSDVRLCGQELPYLLNLVLRSRNFNRNVSETHKWKPS
jgi:hypothetical protein